MKIICNSQIDGDFEGWDGDRVYALTDGTKWKQLHYFYEYVYSYMPHVKVFEDRRGTWFQVDGCSPVEVQRVW